ncbi:MAG: cytochrome b N-terminal domain-containing protein [bacterium]
MMPRPPDPADPSGLFRRISRSIFPGPPQDAKDERGSRQGEHGSRRWFNTLILHFRPRRVPERTLRFSLSWGLGGMAFVLVLLATGTGILLKFSYEPSPASAYESVVRLQHALPYGGWLRSLHHWSANLLVVVAFLHFLRVFFTGAFHPPRQFNWIIGLGLFLALLLSNFTGYLLPWDQLAFWAVTISTGMLEYVPAIGAGLKRLVQGGPEIGPATLSNFYAIHTAVLPAALLILLPFHFWRVRKAGGLVVPRAPSGAPETQGPGPSVPSIPDLILREGVVALVLVAFLLVFSILVEAPLGSGANPGLSPNPTKAPWYFMGIQETLMHFHPLFALFFIPVLTVLALVALPYVRYPCDTAGVWFASTAGRRMAGAALVAALVATPLGILADEYLVDPASVLPGLPAAVTGGLLPFGLVLAGMAGFCTLMGRKFSRGKNELIQMLFVLFAGAFLVFTLTGIFFRGEGMRLAWPWQVP